jgi:hypothetical protein
MGCNHLTRRTAAPVSYDVNMTPRLSDEEVAKRFADAGLIPLEPYKDSHTARLCICTTCGETIKARLTWFSQGNGACNVCAYRQRSESLKKYTAERAEELLRALDYEPLEPYPGLKNARWRARCVNCGHEATPQIKTLEKGHKCQKCSAVEHGEEGRAQRAPEAIDDMRQAGVEPLDPYPGTSAPWRSRCLTCGSEVWPRLSGIRGGQGACLKCGRDRASERQRLPHEKAAALMLERGLEVLEPYVNSNSPWKCRCLTCGSIGAPSFGAVVSGGQGGCFKCGKRKVAASKILDEDVAVAVMRAAQLEPLDPYPGSKHPWRCLCLRCDREVTPRRAGVMKGQGGCKYCAPVGIDRTAPGVLYLLKHEAFQALKIGVTSLASKTDRVERHAQFGWQEISRWDLDNAGIAEVAESLVLSTWRRDLGAPPAIHPDDMPQGGYSETVATIWVTELDALDHVARALSALT